MVRTTRGVTQNIMSKEMDILQRWSDTLEVPTYELSRLMLDFVKQDAAGNRAVSPTYNPSITYAVSYVGSYFVEFLTYVWGCNNYGIRKRN